MHVPRQSETCALKYLCAARTWRTFYDISKDFAAVSRSASMRLLPYKFRQQFISWKKIHFFLGRTRNFEISSEFFIRSGSLRKNGYPSDFGISFCCLTAAPSVQASTGTRSTTSSCREFQITFPWTTQSTMVASPRGDWLKTVDRERTFEVFIALIHGSE